MGLRTFWIILCGSGCCTVHPLLNQCHLYRDGNGLTTFSQPFPRDCQGGSYSDWFGCFIVFNHLKHLPICLWCSWRARWSVSSTLKSRENTYSPCAMTRHVSTVVFIGCMCLWPCKDCTMGHFVYVGVVRLYTMWKSFFFLCQQTRNA